MAGGELGDRYATPLVLLLAGVIAGVAFIAVTVLYDRSESDQSANLDAVSAGAPQETILIRLMAPDDGCWTRTIRDELTVEDDVTEDCGPVTFPVRVQKDVNITFERRPPASWTWCLVAAVNGKIVLTRGPDSNPEYAMEVYWARPELEVNPPNVQIEPVTCAEG